MTQNEHDWTPGAQLSMNRVEAFDFDRLRQLIERHDSDFEAAKQICAKVLEMATDEPTQFPW